MPERQQKPPQEQEVSFCSGLYLLVQVIICCPTSLQVIVHHRLKMHCMYEMSPKQKGSKKWNFTITEMSPKLKYYQNSNDKKNPEMSRKLSSKLKYYQNWIVIKTDMSLKLKYHQIWNVTKTEVSPKLNCHQNWNVIKTEMLPKLKWYRTLYCPQKLKLKFKRLALTTLVLFQK